MLTYNNFLNEKNVNKPDGLPEEVVKSTLIIVRCMYERVKNFEFFEKGNEFFIKFQITPMDFKFIDPNEVLPLDLSSKAMGKREYYVELEYKDQKESIYEVIYRIIFEKMTPEKYKNNDNEKEFVDEYEEELKRQKDEDKDIIIDDEFI